MVEVAVNELVVDETVVAELVVDETVVAELVVLVAELVDIVHVVVVVVDVVLDVELSEFTMQNVVARSSASSHSVAGAFGAGRLRRLPVIVAAGPRHGSLSETGP